MRHKLEILNQKLIKQKNSSKTWKFSIQHKAG